MKNTVECECGVSVIVLTYNHERYIAKALNSIMCQKTKFPFEILVGDDASSDKTSDILRDYMKLNDERLHIFIREKNIGATANLVDLLKHARGKYVASCEGDDFWTDPQKLQKQVDFLESNDLYIACTHPVMLVDENGVQHKKQTLKWVKNKSVYKFKDFNGIYLPGHPSSMVYRNIISRDTSMCSLISDTHLHIADRTIAMLLSAHGNIARIDDNMASYRQLLGKNDANLTTRCFANSSYGKLTNVEIANKLERYARNVLNRRVNYDFLRADMLIRALVKSVIKRSPHEFDCAKKIFKEWINYRKEQRKSMVN